jgi:hypothetical protein
MENPCAYFPHNFMLIVKEDVWPETSPCNFLFLAHGDINWLHIKSVHYTPNVARKYFCLCLVTCAGHRKNIRYHIRILNQMRFCIKFLSQLMYKATSSSKVADLYLSWTKKLCYRSSLSTIRLESKVERTSPLRFQYVQFPYAYRHQVSY